MHYLVEGIMGDKEVILQAIEKLSDPFWGTLDFYIYVFLSVLSIVLSFLAFRAAGKAEQAAIKAGTHVKIQSVTVELTELSQSLERLDPQISYSSARDTLDILQKRVRRFVSPFTAEHQEISSSMNALKEKFVEAKSALTEVRPVGTDDVLGDQFSGYYAIESSWSEINGLLADLIGLFEQMTLVSGGNND